MTTKEDGLFTKHQVSVMNHISKFSNLNLNQSHKCSNDILHVHSVNKSNKDKIFEDKVKLVNKTVSKNCSHIFVILGYTVTDKLQEKRKSWNKSTKDSLLKASKIPSSIVKDEKADKKQWKMDKNDGSKNKSSTLSLHIAAYENSIESDSNEIEDFSKETNTFKSVDSLKAKFQSKDSFEFPRQMDDYDFQMPEIQQFTASQILFAPSQDDSFNQMLSASGKNSAIEPVESINESLGRGKREKRAIKRYSESPEASPEKKKRQYKKKINSEPKPEENKIKKKKDAEPSWLDSMLCQQCGDCFDNENSFAEHKQSHAFARIALRLHIEQKRGNAVTPVYQSPIPPETEALFAAHRQLALRKQIDEVIHCDENQYEDESNNSTEPLDREPGVRIFNTRTQTEVTKNLTPIPNVFILDLDGNDSSQSDKNDASC